MGQVPEVGIVGGGRVARHFHHYFHLLGVPVLGWTRQDPGRPTDLFDSCRTVLLLIKDGAIVPFVEEWPDLRAKRLVHFSGSVATSLAEPAHPLMTFGPALYDLDSYRQIPFVLEAGRPPFAELLPELPNPSFAIPAGQRPYYHALCVMAGNFSTLLWQKLFDELEGRFGIPAAAAHPFLARVAANLASDAGRALTGPLSRRDAATLEANVNALAGDPFQAVYAAFVKAHEHRS